MSPAANWKRPKANAPGSFDDESPWASLPADLAPGMWAGGYWLETCSTTSGPWPSPADKKRFFNISTGIFVRHRVPLLLDYNYLVFCPVEGLLLLQGQHGDGNTLLLLHPFTGDIAELPSVTSIKRNLRAHLDPHGTYENYTDVIASVSVNADGIPRVVIVLLDFSYALCATTKDEQWSVLASCYFPQGWPMTPQGKMYIFEGSTDDNKLQILQIDPTQQGPRLCSKPQKLIIATCPADKIYPPFHLVDCDSDILLVGYTNYTLSSHMLVYRVADLIRGRVDPLTSIEGNALLIGSKTSVSVSSKAVPAIVRNTILSAPVSDNFITCYDLNCGTWSETPARLVKHGRGMACTCSFIDHMFSVCHCPATQ
ncbi:hypothetical protein VPH35_041446 [Triticum aestivum]